MTSSNGTPWRRFGAAVAITTLGLLASCAPGSDLPMLPPLEPGPYMLGIGDRIRVITTGAEELTADFRVGASGDIAVPLLGPIPAAGNSPEQLAREIEHDLTSRKLFRNPSVVVEVTEYRPIDILGEVNRPGEYPVSPRLDDPLRRRQFRRLHLSRDQELRLGHPPGRSGQVDHRSRHPWRLRQAGRRDHDLRAALLTWARRDGRCSSRRWP